MYGLIWIIYQIYINLNPLSTQSPKKLYDCNIHNMYYLTRIIRFAGGLGYHPNDLVSTLSVTGQSVNVAYGCK